MPEISVRITFKLSKGLQRWLSLSKFQTRTYRWRCRPSRVTVTSRSVHDMAPNGMTKEEAKRCFYEPLGVLSRWAK